LEREKTKTKEKIKPRNMHTNQKQMATKMILIITGVTQGLWDKDFHGDTQSN
jgi:hypothetical protein